MRVININKNDATKTTALEWVVVDDIELEEEEEAPDPDPESDADALVEVGPVPSSLRPLVFS